MTRRFWIGAALILPVVHARDGRARIWRAVRRTDFTPHLRLASVPARQSGCVLGRTAIVSTVVGNPSQRSLNMFSLVALGVGAAYSYSSVATLAPGSFPAGLREHGIVPVYFEAAAMITVLVLLGQVLELRAREKTGSAIRALLGLAPKTARRIRDGEDTNGAAAGRPGRRHLRGTSW